VYRSLNAELIVKTVVLLRDRVQERFPSSSLSKVAEELSQTANTTAERAAWIARPLLPLRIATISLIALLAVTLLAGLLQLKLSAKLQSWVEFLQGFESGLNAMVLIGAGIFFLVTLEERIKRQRALRALHELRSLAHIIDMHQLTKDPEMLVLGGPDTKSSPKRTMTNFELSRYLDYCSEMLSLIGKLAALHAQHLRDPVVLSSVDQIEDLTTSLSRKIWQKIMIVNQGEK
jgi:hypothetical protein